MYKKKIWGVSSINKRLSWKTTKENRVHYFLFWHFSLYSALLKGDVNCEQEKFSTKEYLGFTSWERDNSNAGAS